MANLSIEEVIEALDQEFKFDLEELIEGLPS